MVHGRAARVAWCDGEDRGVEVHGDGSVAGQASKLGTTSKSNTQKYLNKKTIRLAYLLACFACFEKGSVESTHKVCLLRKGRLNRHTRYRLATATLVAGRRHAAPPACSANKHKRLH